jgi:hypothetical protein
VSFSPCFISFSAIFLALSPQMVLTKRRLPVDLV